MLRDLLDRLSSLSSWRWPTVQGKVTTVSLERVPKIDADTRLQFAVTYEFFAGKDGPFTGLSTLEATYMSGETLEETRSRLAEGNEVPVRYRPDDPSVNRIGWSGWST